MASYNWPPGGSGGGGGMVTNAANVGTGVGVFQVLSGSVLNFRSVTNGTGLTWVQNANDIQGTVSLSPFSTTDLAEGTNLYFTQARARLSISGTAPVAYDNITGIISMHVADATHDGYLSQSDWAIFSGKQSALTFGDLTDVGTDGITVTSGAGAVIGAGTSISQHVADATHNGYLSQSDWTTFNGKQNALTFGDLTDVGTDGITVTNGTGSVIGAGTSISQHVADATHNGYLSSADWVTFSSAANLVSQGSPGLVAGAGQLLGTNTNDDAASGFVGEYFSLTGSNPGITTSTPSAGTADITLGPGDYDVRAYCHYLGGGGAVADSLIAGVTTTNGTIVGSPGVDYSVSNGLTAAANNVTVCSPVVRIKVAAATTQTVSAIGFAAFAAGSVDLSGNITVRRVR